MSLQELSDATGIPSSTLGNYEKDESVDMSLGTLLTLADFYHVNPFIINPHTRRDWQVFDSFYYGYSGFFKKQDNFSENMDFFTLA